MHPTPAAVFTVGHSNHPIARFIALLAAHGITRVLDVRAWPRSRRHPQFDRDALAAALAAASIGYTHVPELGGMRQAGAAAPGVPRTGAAGWREAYRAHTRSDEFARGIDRVIAAAAEDVVALVCAEADPAACHRWLVADALATRGVTVRHLHPTGPPSIHTDAGRPAQGDLGL